MSRSIRPAGRLWGHDWRGRGDQHAKVEPGSSAVVDRLRRGRLERHPRVALAGARTIIGVDLLDNKLDYAKEFGATHTVNPGRQDLLKTAPKPANGVARTMPLRSLACLRPWSKPTRVPTRGGTLINCGPVAGGPVENPVGSFLMTEK